MMSGSIRRKTKLEHLKNIIAIGSRDRMTRRRKTTGQMKRKEKTKRRRTRIRNK